MFALWPPLVLLFCCMPITQLNLCKPLSCRRRWCRKCSHLGLLNWKRRKPCKSHWLLLKPELLLQECQILLINFQIYTSGWLWQWWYYSKTVTDCSWILKHRSLNSAVLILCELLTFGFHIHILRVSPAKKWQLILTVVFCDPSSHQSSLLW